jgi:hypothetical protein
MKSEIKKFFIENNGSFVPMTDSDLNELCTYEPSLLQLPAVLFLQKGYSYNGDEFVLRHFELKTILKSTLNNCIN